MGIIANLKEKAKKEVQAFKYNRALENDPAVVRNRLESERANVRAEISRVKERQAFEQDKKELQTLKNSTGLRGKISSGLGALRSHLDNVKQKNNQANKTVKGGVRGTLNGMGSNSPGPANNPGAFDIQGSRGMHDSMKGSKSLIMQGPGGSSGGGVFAGGSSAKPKKKKESKTIIIKL